MARTLSSDLVQDINAESSDDVYIILLTISHPNLTDDIRLCDNGLGDLPLAGVPGVVSRGLEFVKIGFSFALPGDPDNHSPYTKIKIDNVHRDIVNAARSINGPADVLIEVVMASDPDLVEISMEGFQLTAVSYDRLTCEGVITIEQFDQEPFPGDYYLPSTTPGVF